VSGSVIVDLRHKTNLSTMSCREQVKFG